MTKDILPRRLLDHELMGATTARCRELGLPSDPTVVGKAIDSALFRYYRELRHEFDLPPDPRGLYHDHERPRDQRLPMPLEVKPRPVQARESTPVDRVGESARKLLHDPDLAVKYLEGPLERESDLVEATKRYCWRHDIDAGRRDPVPFERTLRACHDEWVKFHAGVSRKPEGV